MVKIEVDQDKCLSPRDCRRCQEACPQRLFWSYPRIGRKPGKRSDDWVIMPVLPSLCTACMICEQVCPQKAIKITAGLATAATASGGGMTRIARRVSAGVLIKAGQRLYVP